MHLVNAVTLPIKVYLITYVTALSGIFKSMDALKAVHVGMHDPNFQQKIRKG